MPTIDRSSPIPLYFQLKQILLEKITSDLWNPGDLIPSELELQESFGLSRTTVRQTLSELVNEGHLTRQRGRGTFVSTPKITHDPTTRLEISDYIRKLGLEPGWQLLQRGWVVPTQKLGESLKLQTGEQIYRVVLLLLANNEPIGHHTSYLPEKIGNSITSQELTEDEILTFLRDLPKNTDAHSMRSLEAVPAGEKEVTLLGMKSGDPVLAIELQFIDPSGNPVEILKASFKGNRFKYQISL